MKALSAVHSMGAVTPQERARIVIERLIPGILTDADFITILLSEAATYTGLEDKVEKLTDLVQSLVRSLVGRRREAAFSRDMLRTALVVILLGIMGTVRVARASSLGISDRDIAGFVKTLARASLGIDLDKPSGRN